jgi:DNA-binding transcriptional MerR regulator
MAGISTQQVRNYADAGILPAVPRTGDALEAIAGQPPDTPARPRRGMRIGEVAAYLGIRTSALRTWESVGLLTPGREHGTNYRRFSPADVRDAQMISMLRQGHYPLPQIRPIIDGLRHTGGSDALRAAIAGRNATLTQQATAMLEAASHLHGYITTDSDRGIGRGAGAPPDQGVRFPS